MITFFALSDNKYHVSLALFPVLTLYVIKFSHSVQWSKVPRMIGEKS